MSVTLVEVTNPEIGKKYIVINNVTNSFGLVKLLDIIHLATNEFDTFYKPEKQAIIAHVLDLENDYGTDYWLPMNGSKAAVFCVKESEWQHAYFNFKAI